MLEERGSGVRDYGTRSSSTGRLSVDDGVLNEYGERS
jgi:hypothetical protein